MAKRRTFLVVGGGTLGLAASWALSRRGAEVLTLERYDHVHDLGSHGGFTRVLRHGYHEGDHYVDLVRQAEFEWTALQRRVETPLLIPTGVLSMGEADHPDLRATISAYRRHALPHRSMTAAEVSERWPFRLPDDWVACHSPMGGFLRVAACMNALRAEAEAHGARFRYGAEVIDVRVDGRGPFVRLADGERLDAEQIVVTAGAGLAGLVEDLRSHLTVLRRVVAWSSPPSASNLATLPVWCAFRSDGFFYGFPYGDEGVVGLKLGCHRSSESDAVGLDPSAVDRRIHDRDLAPLSAFLGEHLPSARGPWSAAKTCLYTATPSWDFILDRHPRQPHLIVAGGLSGHGFKFAPTLGTMVADLALRSPGTPSRFPWPS